MTIDANGEPHETTESFGDLDDTDVALTGFVGDDIIASVSEWKSSAQYVIRFPASNPSAYEKVGTYLAATAVNGKAGLMSVVTEEAHEYPACTATGDELMVFTADHDDRQLTGFGDGGFEDDQTIVFMAHQGNTGGFVRCTVSNGDCEAAGAPQHNNLDGYGTTALSEPAYE